MPPPDFSDAPAGGAVVPCPLNTHWIEIELKDEEGKPVPDEGYQIKLPNGDINAGFLDGNGMARLDGIENPGTCQVSFPSIDGADWSFESSTSVSSMSGSP